MNDPNKVLRSTALQSYDILDTLPEKEYDHLTALASYICNTPIALVSLLDKHRQFFKSHHGLEATETPIEYSFCAHAVQEPNNAFIIEDARVDERFKNNPLVTGEPNVVFYAGIPLVDPSGIPLGAFCVIDNTAKKLNTEQVNALKALADQVVQLLELRKARIAAETDKKILSDKTERMENIIDATRAGTWEWNIETDELLVNERWAEIVGYTLEELAPINLTTWHKLLYPEDIQFIKEQTRDCFRKKTTHLETECRLIHKMGHLVWVSSRGSVTKWSDKGKAQMMAGSFIDISERKITEDQQKQALLALSKSEEELSKIMDYSVDLICTFNASGQFIKVSAASFEILGYQPNELIGNPFTNYIHPDDSITSTEELKKIVAGAPITNYENRYIHKKGKVVPMLWSFRWDEKEQLLFCVAKDATEKFYWEQQLISSEKRYKALVENGADVVAIIGASGQVNYISPSITKVLGYTEKEVLAMNLVELIHPSELEGVTNKISECLSKPGISIPGYTARVKHKNGTWRWLEATLVNMLNDPTINGIVDNFRDITEKVRLQEIEILERSLMEQSMNETNDLQLLIEDYMRGIESLFNSMKATILKIEHNRTWSYATPSLSPAFAEAFNGFEIGPAKGACGTAAFTGKRVITENIATDPHWEVFKDIPLQEGLQSCWSQPIFDSKGKVIATFANYFTTIKQPTEEELEVFSRSASLLGVILESNNKSKQLIHSNTRHEYVTKATSDAIWDYDIQNNKLYWGEGFKKLFGHSGLDVTQNYQLWKDHIHPDDAKWVLEKEAKHLGGDEQAWQMEYRFKKANGEIAHVIDKAYVIRNANGLPQRVIGAMQDITIQKREEHRLRLMESVITNTNDAVIITEAEPLDNPGPRIIYVNEAFTKMTGYSSEEVIGKSPRILQGPKTDLVALKKFGEALRRWEPSEITTLNYKKNGEEFWINFSVSPIADETGWFTHWIAIERDVTEQKTLELKQQLFADLSLVFNRYNQLKLCLEDALQLLVTHGGFVGAEIWLPNSDGNSVNLLAQFYPNSLISTNVITIPLIHNDTSIGTLLVRVKNLEYKKKRFGQLFEDLSSLFGLEIHRKKVEIELQQIFTSAADIICVGGYDGYFKKINPAASILLEYSEEELLSKPFIDFVYEADKASTIDENIKLISGNKPHDFENRFVTKSGKIKWLSWTATPSKEEGLIFAIAKDTTEEKALQELLDKANHLAKIGSWEVDLLEQNVYWSPITKDLHETPEDYNPTLSEGLLFYKEGYAREAIKEAVNNSIKNNEPWDVELPIITAKGNERWVRSIGQAEFINGKAIRLFGSFQDIHLRKIAELELQKAYEDRNNILESIGDGFFAVDNNFIVTYWNQQAEKIFGKRREDVLNKNLWDIFSDATDTNSYRVYREALATQQIISFDDYYPPLNMWFEVTSYPTETGLSVYFKNISIRKQAEEAIRQTNERFEKVAKATNDAIWDWDLLANSIYRTGEGFTNLFGYTIQEANSVNFFWQNKIHPEDLNRVIASQEKVINDPSKNFWECEYRYLKKEGVYAYVYDRGYVVRDEAGIATRIIGSTQDITYRKETEESLRDLNNRLQQHTKELEISNSELEQFAYVASHDLQEPLRMITGFLTQLEKKYSEQLDQKAHQYIHFAVDGAKRMREIILDLLQFSKIGKTEDTKELINLNELVEDYCQLRKKLIEEKSAIITNISLPTINGFRAPLTQVFHNLLDNALKYSKDDVASRIYVRSKETKLNWEFSVEDNGIGIEKEYFDKIFVIFQRLKDKDVHGGTGMGLAIVKKIIKALQGDIWIESELGKGTTFYFTIPKTNG